MLRVKEAVEHILKSVKPLGLEKVDLLDALGRVLGEDVFSSRNIPPKDNSAMDGYAFRADATKNASTAHPRALTIIENIPAGYSSRKAVGPGQASKIMTGAYIPEGADTVIKVEEIETDGKTVRIFKNVEQGQHIRYAGEDVKTGECVLKKGTIIRPSEVGMLASLGRSFINVYQKPFVAIIATGNELVDIDGDIAQEKIISSNTYSTAAQVIECGGIPMNLGIAKDTKEDILRVFKSALRADVIVSSAGISVGDYDYVKDVMKEVGIHIDFWKVAQRPGKPLAFGTINGKPVFGLPGNPVSSMISFEEYIRPTILKMTGHGNIFRKAVKAIALEDITKKKNLRFFIRGQVQLSDGRFTVKTTGEQGSGILKSMVLANALIVIPEDITTIKAGETVTVQMIDNSLELTPYPEYLD